MAGQIAGGFLLIEQRLTRPDELLFIGMELRRQIRRVKIKVILADQRFRRGCPHVARQRHVGKRKPAIGIFGINIIRYNVDQSTQKISLFC